MITLSLADVQTVVLAAWNKWLDGATKGFDVKAGKHTISVTVNTVGHSFDCGMPGYNMANKDIKALEAWVPKKIVTKDGSGRAVGPKNVGNTGVLNVLYRAAKDFNFHINLVSKV